MTYRSDFDAIAARADALETELAQERRARSDEQARAGALAAELAATRAQVQIPPPSAPPPPPMAMPYPPQVYLPPGNATTVLVVGVLSLLLCSLLGPVAWAMGNAELRRIDAGQVSPFGRGSASAGRVLGIVATVILGCALLVLLAKRP